MVNSHPSTFDQPKGRRGIALVRESLAAELRAARGFFLGSIPRRQNRRAGRLRNVRCAGASREFAAHRGWNRSVFPVCQWGEPDVTLASSQPELRAHRAHYLGIGFALSCAGAASKKEGESRL